MTLKRMPNHCSKCIHVGCMSGLHCTVDKTLALPTYCFAVLATYHLKKSITVVLLMKSLFMIPRLFVHLSLFIATITVNIL